MPLSWIVLRTSLLSAYSLVSVVAVVATVGTVTVTVALPASRVMAPQRRPSNAPRFIAA